MMEWRGGAFPYSLQFILLVNPRSLEGIWAKGRIYFCCWLGFTLRFNIDFDKSIWFPDFLVLMAKWRSTYTLTQTHQDAIRLDRWPFSICLVQMHWRFRSTQIPQTVTNKLFSFLVFSDFSKPFFSSLNDTGRGDKGGNTQRWWIYRHGQAYTPTWMVVWSQRLNIMPISAFVCFFLKVDSFG